MNSETAIVDSPIGRLKVTVTGDSVCEIIETELPVTPLPYNPFLTEICSWLSDYFNGADTPFGYKLQPAGTPFQQSVWAACRTIPRGRTLSYSELAQSIGRPTAVRAVASAVARNPILIAIPCHRVVGRNSLGGFRLGLPAKLALLALEKTPRPCANQGASR